MNTGVRCPDIVQDILWHRREHKKTLASCARVSRVWHDEACSLLWSEQYGLNNIMRLLGFGTHNLENKRLEFGGLHDISRLQHYARWIKHLICTRDSVNTLELLVSAQVLAAGACLFPSIKKLAVDKALTMNNVFPSRIQNTRLAVMTSIGLIGSSLEEIDFGTSPPEITALILATAMNRPWRVVTIRLETVTTLEEDRAVFCNFIKSSSGLQNITVQTSWIDFSVIQALGLLDHLWALTLADDRNELLPTEPFNSPETMSRLSKCSEIWFSSLIFLQLRQSSFVITSLLETAFAHAQLLSLRVTYMVGAAEDTNRRIKLPFDTSRITSLSLVWEAINPLPDIASSHPRLDKKALQCLSLCSSLEFLIITPLRVPNLDNADILSLSKSWPALLHLTIVKAYVLYLKEDIPVLTVAILGQLQNLCPQLKSVALPMAGTISNPPAQILPVSLTKVDFNESFLFDPVEPRRKEMIMEVGAYLAVALPSSCVSYFHRLQNLQPGRVLHPGISSAEWTTLVASRKQSIDELKDYIKLSRMIRKYRDPLQP